MANGSTIAVPSSHPLGPFWSPGEQEPAACGGSGRLGVAEEASIPAAPQWRKRNGRKARETTNRTLNDRGPHHRIRGGDVREANAART